VKKYLTTLSTFCCLLLLTSAALKITNSYKSAFYNVISSSDTTKINQLISTLSGSNMDSKLAYTGALLIKKAGLVKSANQKLICFKDGKRKLEKAIAQDPNNGEYRFLRLMMQENCPPILKYNANIQEDLLKVKESFKSFDSELRSVVVNYSKKSRYLKESDL